MSPSRQAPRFLQVLSGRGSLRLFERKGALAVREYRVEKQGVRLDAFLQKAEPSLTKGALHRYLRENKIKVNGKRLPLSARLAVGDTVRLYAPQAAPAQAGGPAYLAAKPYFTPVYEDAQVLVAQKPAGLLVQDEAGVQALANLPSKETLIAKIMGSMMSSMSKFVYCVEAIRKQKAGE